MHEICISEKLSHFDFSMILIQYKVVLHTWNVLLSLFLSLAHVKKKKQTNASTSNHTNIQYIWGEVLTS